MPIHTLIVYFLTLPSSKVQANCKQENRKKKYTLTVCIFLFLIYIVFYSGRGLVCLRRCGGACRCLCRISTFCSWHIRLFSSNLDCGMARSGFPTRPRSRLGRCCLGGSRSGCWCRLICCRRKALRQSTIQLGRCSSGRALCPRIRPRSLRNRMRHGFSWFRACAR